MIASDKTKATIKVIEYGAKSYPPNSVERNICNLLVDISNIIYSSERTSSMASQAPKNFESLVEFAHKNNFGRSTLSKIVTKNKLKSKDYYLIIATDKNTSKDYVDPIPFLEAVIKYADSTHILNKAHRAHALYKREEKARGTLNG